MEQIKRSRSNIIQDYDDNKRRKSNNIRTIETNYLTDKSVTIFEGLSNELIYELFEFLDFHHAYQAFYNLNQRFQNLFINSNFPIQINISSISKSVFQQYSTDIIIPYAYRIELFRLSNPFTADMSLLLFPMMKNLIRLETLILNNIESNYIKEILNHLSSLPILSSLIITSIDNIKNQNDIYYKIFHLPTLKYCQMLFETSGCLIPLSITINEFSPIKHLVINNKVLIEQLDSLLSYVPQLHHLSIGYLDGYGYNQIRTSSISLNYLTNISLKLYSVKYNDFEQIIKDFFHQVQILRIAVCCTRFSTSNIEYLNADRWEQLISIYMLNLRIFDFQHQHHVYHNSNDRAVYEAHVNKFNSSFWTTRQWFFEYQYYRTTRTNAAVFYSTNPYRRKCYTLYEEREKTIWSHYFKIPEDPIHHVYLQSTNTMNQFVGDFPNATKLTLCESFNISRGLDTINLNQIIPMKQLSTLIIDCHRFPFEQIIELLQSTPNVHTLKLDSILLYGTESYSIEQSEIFRIVSDRNIMTNMTISKEITLEKIQLLTALFPRLECLTINLNKEALESIARFLLSKSNNNTCYLSLLCISKQRRDFLQTLKTMIDTEKLLHDYTLKLINRKIYLWW